MTGQYSCRKICTGKPSSRAQIFLFNTQVEKKSHITLVLSWAAHFLLISSFVRVVLKIDVFGVALPGRKLLLKSKHQGKMTRLNYEDVFLKNG